MNRKVFLGALFLLGCNSGCSVTEAVIDGFFGGISDTVAAVIMGVLTGGA